MCGKCVAVLTLLAAFCAAAQGAPAATRPAPAVVKLDLKIEQKDWGKAQQRDVDVVLRAAGRELLAYFPNETVEPIRVQAKGGPIVLYRRDPEGRAVVKLNTGDTYWAQYIYQFSHELCHILCRFDDDPTGNKWFEESLCELASLFVLRQAGESWKEHPPYPNWKSYAPHLSTYAQQRIDKSSLHKGQTLAAWYRDNAAALRANATDREKNNVVAAALLPLFEADPQHWAAVRHLNDGRPTSPQTFQQYLQDWHDHTPREHRTFIRKIAGEFGIKLKSVVGSL